MDKIKISKELFEQLITELDTYTGDYFTCNISKYSSSRNVLIKYFDVI